MIQVPEYDPNSPTIITESDVSNSEVQWFRKQIERVAGKNPHGKPILTLVWGVTHLDPMSAVGSIKYLDFIHRGEQYGERRWFIEIWRSPEFLNRSGRYQIEARQDEDGTKLLESFPREGCYDYWLRLERMNLTYHPPDGEVLQVVRALWAWEQMPQNKRDELEQADRELQRRAMILAQRQQSGNAPQFGSGLIVPA